MPDTYLITLDGQGRFTIPPAILEQWSLSPGDELTFVHFGGFAVLTPVALKTPELSRQYSRIMDEEGVTLADLLEGAAEERLYSDRLQHKGSRAE